MHMITGTHTLATFVLPRDGWVAKQQHGVLEKSSYDSNSEDLSSTPAVLIKADGFTVKLSIESCFSSTMVKLPFIQWESHMCHMMISCFFPSTDITI